MATWHQNQVKTRLYSTTEWNVVIDPPNQFRAIVSCATRELAEVYLRNLQANNPGAAAHAYILNPAATPSTSPPRAPKPRYLPQRYKTQEGARKRAAFENSLALSEFLRGFKPRHYKYRTMHDGTSYRVERITPST